MFSVFGCVCREPSDSKASGGDSSHGHSRLASGATPGPTGASPGGSGAGPGGVGGVPGMPGHSLMSSSGHLQAPTSTTPEGSGTGLHPSFLSMDPHASPLGPGEIQIKQEISAGELLGVSAGARYNPGGHCSGLCPVGKCWGQGDTAPGCAQWGNVGARGTPLRAVPNGEMLGPGGHRSRLCPMGKCWGQGDTAPGCAQWGIVYADN